MEGKTVPDCNRCEDDDVGAGTYSYDEAVELTGHGWYNILVLVACSVASLAVAVDIFGFSVVVAAANCDLKLDITLSGILNTIPLAGVLCAIPWGYYADTKGRRKALLLASTVGFLFSALCSLSPSWQVMLALKLLNSLFSSVLYNLTMTYLGENTSGVRRRRFLFIMNSVNLGAEFVFYLTSYFVLPLGFSFFIPWLGIDFRAWRVYTLLISLPLALSALLLLPLYESPKLLVSIGKTDEALDVLRKIYKWNGGQGEYPVKRVSLNDDEELTTGSIRDFILKQAVPLFKPPLLWRTLQLFVLGGICGSTNNMFLMWYPKIVNLFFKSTAGDSVGELSFCERVNSNGTVVNEIEEYTCDDTISQYTIFAGIMLGLVFALMNLAVSMVAVYRRLVLMAIYLLSAVCLLLVNWLKEPVSNLIAFTMIQCTVIGFGSIGSYFVDLYPTSQRGLVSGLTNMFSRLMSMAGVNIVAALIISHCTLMFYMWSAVVASGVVLALFLPPDTKLYK